MSRNTSTDIWIAGAAAAFTVDLIVYPLDTVKTRMQSPDYKRLYLNEGTNVVKRAALFRGLYQGIGSVILATLPSSGAFFTTYEGTKSLLKTYNPAISSSSSITPRHLLPDPLIHSLSSGLAELVSCAILTPAEVIKQNAQMVTSSSSTSTSSQKQPTISTNATLQTLHSFRHNPLALWRGYSILASRNLPFTALQFPIFERFKAGLLRYRRERHHDQEKSGTKTPPQQSTRREDANAPLTILETSYITALAAGAAGSIAAVVTTPIDVVKTRIMLSAASSFASQSTASSNTSKSSSSTSTNTTSNKLVDAFGSSANNDNRKKIPDGQKTSLQIAREIIHEHGWKGLWRGGALRAVWTMLGSGLYLGAYEGGRLYLERDRERRGG